MYENHALKLVPRYKKGSGIHIKESTKGSFTKYCNGKVTNECIQRGKNSPDPKIRKKAIFAQNSRKWKHQFGGLMWADTMQFANDTFQKSGLPASQPHSTQMDIDAMNQQLAQNMAQKQAEQTVAMHAIVGGAIGGTTGAIVGAAVGKQKAENDLQSFEDSL